MLHKSLLSLLLGASCALYAKAPMNLEVAKRAVDKYYQSGEFDKDVKRITKKAWNKLKKIKITPKTAVVFDIDDTVLGSHETNKKIGFGHLLVCNPNWAYSNFPAIKPVKELYDQLIEKGFKIIFLSNREHKYLDITKENLKNAGYTTYEKLIIRKPGESLKGGGKFKEQTRIDLTEKDGYDIVATFGDQKPDLEGKYTGFKFKIPNLLYQVTW